MEVKISGERKEMIVAMDAIMRALNDEEIFDQWLSIGVADGDIIHEEIQEKISETESDFVYYEDDENFADLMDTFLCIIYYAISHKHIIKEKRNGVLYCDGVISKPEIRE